MLGYKNLKVNTVRTVDGAAIIWVTEQRHVGKIERRTAVTDPLTAEQALELGSLCKATAQR